MRIGFVTLDWSPMRDPETLNYTPGGAGWYRIAMPQAALAANGIEAFLGHRVMFDGTKKVFCVQDWEEDIHEDLDVVVIQRWMDQIAPTAIQIARESGQIIINDVDDWYDGLATTNAAWYTSHPRNNEWSNRDHYRAALAASSGITCSTPFLVDRMKEINPNVELVRNAIDVDRWPTHDLGGQAVVGWVGATPYRSGDTEVLRGILPQWLSDNDAAMFHGGHFVGATSFAESVRMPEHGVRKVPMQSILQWPNMFKYFNIGIVPLSAVPFNDAKSAIKGMEYAAAGLPFIASDSPEYRWLNQSGLGALARQNRPKEWLRELNKLRDPDYRHMIGEENRMAVKAFDIASRWTDWRDAYERIAAA